MTTTEQERAVLLEQLQHRCRLHLLLCRLEAGFHAILLEQMAEVETKAEWDALRCFTEQMGINVSQDRFAYQLQAQLVQPRTMSAQEWHFGERRRKDAIPFPLS
ncbi:unnamed protein product [Durusdinium trenchii]|uniref:Uncharacterized protein n=2 Tax=Durusdinium trenchii TaxID=1381693 RepID=A0ABP0NY89_9DINO